MTKQELERRILQLEALVAELTKEVEGLKHTRLRGAITVPAQQWMIPPNHRFRQVGAVVISEPE